MRTVTFAIIAMSAVGKLTLGYQPTSSQDDIGLLAPFRHAIAGYHLDALVPAERRFGNGAVP